MSVHTNMSISPYDLPPLPYYERKTYLQSDFKEGVVRTENGRRVIILPQEMVMGVHKAIEYETGRAWNLVTYLCGRRWGERLLNSVKEEWRHYYRTSVGHAQYDLFDKWLTGYFRFHGWGLIETDFDWESKGLVQFRIHDSVLDRLLSELPGGYVNEIFAGLLASWVSALSGADLECVEIASPQVDDIDYARFVVGMRPRIEAARRERASGGDTEAMIEALLNFET